ncbi:internal scaffolding protein [Blackfly microvirus SF02]|uniref:Internal scaffolding protein n=1 Tax=Blackfly microvirus SF02 TaxID=2576452 RepID=A0A4P8PJJ7_9VIRU|nr:internal scaffolding protein [Blackfly microvirus SF02]
MAKKLHSFYRPHPRLQEQGELVNPVSGEVTYPPSMTKQEFQAECDINNILKHFSVTGMLRHVSAKAASGAYQNLPDGQDFQDSLHTVQRATEAFMTLPSKLRARFDNEPSQFLSFVTNPANADELRKLGLANKIPEIVPTLVKVIPDEPPSDKPPPKKA